MLHLGESLVDIVVGLAGDGEAELLNNLDAPGLGVLEADHRVRPQGVPLGERIGRARDFHARHASKVLMFARVEVADRQDDFLAFLQIGQMFYVSQVFHGSFSF